MSNTPISTLYWVSDGKIKPESFEDIKEAADRADEVKGLVLIVTGSNPWDCVLVYSHGERAALAKLK